MLYKHIFVDFFFFYIFPPTLVVEVKPRALSIPDRRSPLELHTQSPFVPLYETFSFNYLRSKRYNSPIAFRCSIPPSQGPPPAPPPPQHLPPPAPSHPPPPSLLFSSPQNACASRGDCWRSDQLFILSLKIGLFKKSPFLSLCLWNCQQGLSLYFWVSVNCELIKLRWRGALSPRTFVFCKHRVHRKRMKLKDEVRLRNSEWIMVAQKRGSSFRRWQGWWKLAGGRRSHPVTVLSSEEGLMSLPSPHPAW